jgi:hypothetical protein
VEVVMVVQEAVVDMMDLLALRRCPMATAPFSKGIMEVVLTLLIRIKDFVMHLAVAGVTPPKCAVVVVAALVVLVFMAALAALALEAMGYHHLSPEVA